MDVSMPFMGGLEATQIIRQYEHEHGLDNVPIIALTAHASECSLLYFLRQSLSPAFYLSVIGDRERCLEAGMVRQFSSFLSIRSELISL